MEDLQLDKEELQKMLNSAQREYVKKVLTSEIEKVDAFIAKEQARIEEHKELQKYASETKSEIIYSKIAKYGWEDVGDKVKIYVTDMDGIKEHPKDQISVEFFKDSFDLKIEGFQGKNSRLCYPKLKSLIVPEKCKYTIKSSSISITLHKADSKKWTDLKSEDSKEGLGGDSNTDTLPGMGGAAGADGGDPNKDLMGMMKKMYEEGDENTKKMMTEAMLKAQSDTMQGKSPVP